jgi:ABC-type nickel/cobalt efflux system permease component RcnA
MNWAPQILLVGAVAAVGVLHTAVPDHWVPIALIARERGWSKAETARAAVQAGAGHVVSTLLIGLALWVAGAVFAHRFGRFVDIASSLALIGLGGWIALSAWREVDHSHGHPHGHTHRHDRADHHQHRHFHPAPLPSPPPRSPGHPRVFAQRAVPPGYASDGRSVGQPGGRGRGGEGWGGGYVPAAAEYWAPEADPLYAPLRGETAVLTRHLHLHRHGRGRAHLHWHDHIPETTHPVLTAFAAAPPLHRHRHKTTARTALLVILGSSPMVEGIPAFFAAAKYGAALISLMAAVFALSTIATYAALCVYSSVELQRLHLGPVERYGEVLSGAIIVLVGVAFGLWPVL